MMLLRRSLSTQARLFPRHRILSLRHFSSQDNSKQYEAEQQILGEEDFTKKPVSGFISKSDAMDLYVLDEEDFNNVKTYRTTHPEDDEGVMEPLIRYRKSDVLKMSRNKWKSMTIMEAERKRRIGKDGTDISELRRDLLLKRKTRRAVAEFEARNVSIPNKFALKKNVSDGSFGVIHTSVLATLVSASFKIAAAAYTGSLAMTSEAVRASFETGNQMLYVIGQHKSLKAPTVDHPYGFGLSVYLFSFLASCGLLFGGSTCLIEGVRAVINEDSLVIETPWVAASVLLIAVMADFRTLNVALTEVKVRKKTLDMSYANYLVHGPDSAVASIFVEDAIGVLSGCAALMCLAASIFSGNAYWDAWGSIFSGSLTAFVGGINCIRNYNYLHIRSVPEHVRNKAIEIIEASEIVKSVHDVKAIVLQPRIYQLKAEINVEGAALSDLVEAEFAAELEELRSEFQNIPEEHRFRFYQHHFADLLQFTLGRETDKIEASIRKEMPEFKFIDLETL